MPPAQPRGVHPGDELDYAVRSTNLTVTAGSAGTAETWIDGAEIIVDGQTRLKIEAWSVLISVGASQDGVVELYEDSTDVGRLMQVSDGTGGGGATAYGVMFRTPSAGRHTYHAKAWGSSGITIYGALGCPSWLRVTRA